MARSQPRVVDPLDQKSMEAVALRYLQRFAATEKRLAEVLKRRHRNLSDDEKTEAMKVIEAVTLVMREAGLVDDAAFAKGFVQSKHRGGASIRKIQQKAIQKGVPRELLDQALENLDEEIGDLDRKAAKEFVRRKRLGHFRDQEKREEEARRDLAKMARAGFSYGIARDALSGDDDSN